MAKIDAGKAFREWKQSGGDPNRIIEAVFTAAFNLGAQAVMQDLEDQKKAIEAVIKKDSNGNQT